MSPIPGKAGKQVRLKVKTGAVPEIRSYPGVDRESFLGTYIPMLMGISVLYINGGANYGRTF